jgi:hypothetical protein
MPRPRFPNAWPCCSTPWAEQSYSQDDRVVAQDRITITIDPEVLEEPRARVVVPSVVVAETVRGNGPRDAPVNHVLASVDAIVVAEAAARAPSVVFTTAQAMCVAMWRKPMTFASPHEQGSAAVRIVDGNHAVLTLLRGHPGKGGVGGRVGRSGRHRGGGAGSPVLTHLGGHLVGSFGK